jgi:DNA-binding MarR family transcriptional regulator
MTKLKKLKRVVIKEELVALTGKVEQAIVLNQFVYWSERVKDTDKYLKEEMERIRKFSDGSRESEEDIKETLSNGWIYKTAAEMKDECMFEKSETTMERIIKALVENGWLDRRTNPKYKWDKTYQYRVNILKIQRDLIQLGYSLEGYSLGEIDSKHDEDTNLQNEDSTIQNEGSTLQNEDSTLQFEGAIPEITTKSTSNTTLQSVCSEEQEILSLLESRSDIKPHTHTQIIKLLNIIKTRPTFQYSVFADTLNLVDFEIDDMSYFKAAIKNNLKKGYVRPSADKATTTGSTRKEVLPDWFDDKKGQGQVEPKQVKKSNSEAVDPKKEEIERMLQQLRE